MKKYHKIQIESIDTEVPDRKVRTSITYSEGGMSYLSGTSSPRGYWLHVQPVTDKGDGFLSYTAFSGYKALLVEVPRFNQRKFEAVAAGAKDLPIYKQLVEQVLATKDAVPAIPETAGI